MNDRCSQFLQKLFFRVRERIFSLLVAPIRRCYWSVQGMCLGRGIPLPRLLATWPHQVQIGAHCILEEDIFFKFDGVWRTGLSIIIGNKTFIGKVCEFNIRQSMRMGNQCLIAWGVKFVDHDHGIERQTPICEQAGPEAAIIIGDDVWIGANAVVLKGVNIGPGSVVAAGAVVTGDIPPFEIWAGVPACKIKER